MTGDQSASSWEEGTLAKSPAKVASSKGAIADRAVLTRVDPAPPATPADIEDLSFWLADQFVSNAFEVFYSQFLELCLPGVRIERPSKISETTLEALFKDKHNKWIPRVLLKDKLASEKTRMRKAWFIHQRQKLSTMVAQLNILFKSEKVEACNVNNVYQVPTSSIQRLLSSRHPTLLRPLCHPLILCSPSLTSSPPRQNG